ncbi:predicted protein [Chaetoceros tenuissimus]|uniref:MYND-type domain-containing protein n=1 Tax=Chaetoceros tenuissimus TaxID=426638 RepID=A0AAD3D3K0_9STRA|nr:predicted protein [Chaetoceros tenuissimus]
MSSDQGFTAGEVESLLKAAVVAAAVVAIVFYLQKEAAAPPPQLQRQLQRQQQRQRQRQQQRNMAPDQLPSMKQPETLRRNQVDKIGNEDEIVVSAGLYNLSHCGHCYKFLPKQERKLCAKCKLVAYCSKECQVKDWKTHKKNSCVCIPDGSRIKMTHEKQTSDPNAVRHDTLMGLTLGLRIKAIFNPIGLSRPFLPGWPLRQNWPVSQDALLGLHEFVYRYPGFEYDEKPQALPNWSKIESWNKYASHLDTEQMIMNPTKYIEEIMPYVEEDSPVPMALHAMQFLYLVLAMEWQKNSSRPSEDHKHYFSKSVEYMKKFSQTGEIECEYMLGLLLLCGNEDFSYPSNVEKGLELLEKCAQRGGDGGEAAWSIAIYYGEESAKTGSESYENYLNILKYLRLAAEQGHADACEQMVREGRKLVEQRYIEPNWIKVWTYFQVPQIEKSLSEMNDIELFKYKKRIARAKEQVEWDLYGFEEAM